VGSLFASNQLLDTRGFAKALTLIEDASAANLAQAGYFYFLHVWAVYGDDALNAYAVAYFANGYGLGAAGTPALYYHALKLLNALLVTLHYTLMYIDGIAGPKLGNLGIYVLGLYQVDQIFHCLFLFEPKNEGQI
jgi:hypothetical protein